MSVHGSWNADYIEPIRVADEVPTEIPQAAIAPAAAVPRTEHEQAETPSWDTKLRCECGFEAATKRELQLHLAASQPTTGAASRIEKRGADE